MTMLKIRILAGVFSLIALTGTAHAQLFTSPNDARRAIPTDQLITPTTVYGEGGAWYNPAQSGSGWYFAPVATSPTERLMTGALFGYDLSGAANWYVTGGVAAPRFNPNLSELFEGKPLAVWEAPLFEGTAGSCPTCAYVRPSVRPSSLGSVRVEFLTPTDAAVTLNGSPVGPITHSDSVFQSDLYARLVGLHEGVRQSWMTRDLSGPTVRLLSCRFDLRPMENPAPRNVWEAAPGVPVQSLPHPSARWLRLWSECAAAFGSGPTTFLDNRISIAVPPAGAGSVAIAIQEIEQAGADPLTPIRAADGSLLGYRLEPGSLTARIFVSGRNEITYAGRLNHDNRSLDRVALMSRSAR
jgi:hypothetical protein